MIRRCALAFAVILSSVFAAFGHHSFTASFLMDQKITLEGKIFAIEIRNPHSAVVIDVMDPAGRSSRWEAEWSSPAELERIGIGRSTFTIGETVTITGGVSRDAPTSRILLERMIRHSNGWSWDLRLDLQEQDILATRRGASAPPDPGPAADMVRAALEAFNSRNLAYFTRWLADDVVWLDEDGHAITPKRRVLASFLQPQLTGRSRRTIVPVDIRTSLTGDAAWGSFAYTLDTDGVKKQGLATMVFRRLGDEWFIVLVHAAANHPVTHTPLP